MNSEHPSEEVAAVAHAIARHFTLPQVCSEAISRTRGLCDGDGASLLLHDEQTGELYFDVVAGASADQLQGQVRLAKGKGIAGAVAIDRQPLKVDDVRTHPSFADHVDEATGFRTRSMLAVPLVVDNRLLGIIEVVRSDKRDPFTDLELTRLKQLAPHLAVAVHNAQVTDELKRTKEHLLANNHQLEQRVRERTEMISRAKREWELTFDAITEPIALVNDDFTVQRANREWATHTKTPVTKVPGSRCYQVLAGRTSPCPGCPLVQGNPELGKAEVSLPGDRVVQVTAWKMQSERGPISVVQYHDVTDQRRLEGRVAESERMAAVGQLAAGAAHEINNPLAAITANLSLLADYTDGQLEPAEVSAMLQESLEAARRVRDVVAALRDFARTQRDKQEDTDVNAPLKRAAQAEASGAPITLTLTAQHTVHSSPRELDVAFTQLVRNARQAVAPGQEIEIVSKSDGHTVTVEVTDKGVGIKRDIIGRIFEPFFTTRGVGKGMGLGLTSVFAIVRRAGGRIDVKSEPGQGTTFTLSFPASGPAKPQQQHAAA